MRVIRTLVVDLRPLRRRDFSLLFGASLASGMGSRFTQIAVPWQIWQLTHSTIALGLFGLVQLGPVLALALVGGALADARDRRRLLMAAEVAAMALSVLLLLNALQPRPLLWALYVLSAAQAAAVVVQRPSLDALPPRLVPPSELTAAGAVMSLQSSAGRLAGPALAGVAIATLGVPAAYAVDVASFVVGLVLLLPMRAVPPLAAAGEVIGLRRIGEGLAYAVRRRDLLGTYAVDLVAMFLGMPEALYPAVAAVLGGPAVLGLLTSAEALGSTIAFATSGWTGRVARQGLGVLFAALLWGAAIAGFGLTAALHALPAALALLTIAGAADGISGVFRTSIWNHTVPDVLRGRMASIELLSYTVGPLLGDAESGLVAAAIGVAPAVALGGVLCVAGCLVCGAALPAFRRLRIAIAA